MKYIRQFGIILFVTLLAELLENLLPFPVPASIYGLLLMWALLVFRVVPLENVERAGDFLIEIMPVMFIPAAAGILTSYQALREILIPLVSAIFVTTVLVMAVTGLVSQKLIRSRRKIFDKK